MKAISYLVFLLLALSLSSCNAFFAQTPGCKQMASSELRAQIGRELTMDDLLTWISTTYQIPREDISVSSRGDGDEVSLSWKDMRVEYQADIRAARLDSVALRFFQPMKPTIAEVIACFGEPDLYSARYGLVSEGGPQLDLDLLFPTQGIFAWGTIYFEMNTRQPPAITPNFPTASLIFKQPGPTNQFTRFLCWDSGSDVCQKIAPSYRPWVKDWKAIEIGPQIQQ